MWGKIIFNSLTSVLLLNRQGNAWKNFRDTALAVIALSEQLTYLQRSLLRNILPNRSFMHGQLFFSGSRGHSGNLIIRYFLQADIPGKYRVLPARGSLMYYPEVNGHSEDDEITIK